MSNDNSPNSAQIAALISAINALVQQVAILNDNLKKKLPVDVTGVIKVQP